MFVKSSTQFYKLVSKASKLETFRKFSEEVHKHLRNVLEFFSEGKERKFADFDLKMSSK